MEGRDGELLPEVVPLSASLAPGVHSEAQMQLLKTLGAVILNLTESHGLDTYGKDSKGHSLASAMKLDRPTLYGFPGPTASILSAPPASVAPPRPSPAPPCLPLQKLLLTQVFPTLQPLTPCPVPPASAPLFCPAAHFLVLLWALLQATDLEAPPGLTFQGPQGVVDPVSSPSRQGW